MELGPGTLIGGRYRLERLLGRGGMGEVWAAQHTVTRRAVALKFLNVDQGVVPQMRRRFMREARAATAVNHPNVIQVHDVFELEDETPVMVMDLLTGEALGDKLAREGKLSVETAARLLVPVISAVGTAHAAGVVHRDLKPENIFLVRAHDGDGEPEVKVLDFGIAKLGASLDLAQTGAVTGTGAVLGTPYYMALEQAYGEKDVDHRADIWSLGVVIYECLVGRRPIEGDNFGQIVKFLNHGTIPRLAEVAPHVPADLDTLVFRMLQRAREDRPQDLREVSVVLRRYTTIGARTFGGPQAPQPTGGAETPEPAAAAPEVPTVRGMGASTPRVVDPDMVTMEVASAEKAPEPRSQPGSGRGGPARPAPPADVTLAESAAAVPAATPPTSRRTALIAGVGAVVGIAVSAALVLGLAPSARRPHAAPTATTTVEEARPVEAARPVEEARPVDTATGAASGAPAPPASSGPAPLVLKPLKPGPLGSARPPASGAPSARPAASASARPGKPKGGLVDDPPF
jgi:serine/threonine-protein kinase